MNKKRVKDLAALGGEPYFSEPLHVGRPNTGDRDSFSKRINEIFDRNWLTNNGTCVQELSRQIAKYLGADHCILVCNATVGLEVLVRALGLSGEVIVPSFTFVATAHALQWLGIRPIFCDIDPQTHNLDPKQVEALITPSTTGILGVHVWGRPCAVEELRTLAEKRGLKLIFDAAHAFGCSAQGSMMGSFGEAEVFSFHATKFFNSFEGGAIVTKNAALAERINAMINFGFQGYDKVISLGTNAKMSEASAAMGLTNFEAMDRFIETNRNNYRLYQSEFKDLDGIELVTYDESQRNNYQYIIVEVDGGASQLRRDHLIKILHAENVLARRYFYPGCHLMEPYRSIYPEVDARLPKTNRLAARVVSLPNGTGAAPEDIRALCQIIRLTMKHGAEIADLLPLS